MIRSLLVPVVARYQTMSSQLEKEENEKSRSMMISVMSHSMAVVTGVSKAFNSLKDIKALGCFQMYYEVLQVFLTCLQVRKPRFSTKYGEFL